jgi:hypothetical protein
MNTMVAWLLSHKKTVIFLVILIVTILITYNFFAHNAIVRVDATSDIKAQEYTVYASTDASTVKVGSAGLIVVPRETKSLIVVADGRLKTQSGITIPWYGYATKTVHITADKNAKKVAFESTFRDTCSTYDPAADQLAFYDCLSPTGLYTYQAPTNGRWGVNKIADMKYVNREVRPYLGGVIGITYEEDEGVHAHSPVPIDTSPKAEKGIEVIKSNGKRTSYTLPLDANLSTMASTKIFTDHTDPTNKRFILADPLGVIHLGTPTSGGNVTYTRIAPPPKYNYTKNDTTCTLNQEKALCYYGDSAVAEFIREQEAAESKIGGELDPTFVELRFDEGLVRTGTIDEAISPDNLIISPNGEFFAKSYKALYAIKREGNASYRLEELSQNVDSVAVADQVYFVQDEGLFKVDPQTKNSHQVFSSSHIQLHSVYAVAGNVFMFGTTGDTNATYAYQLQPNVPHTSGSRLIDLFPLSETIPGTVATDLVGDRIYVQLAVAYDKSSQNPVDQGEVALLRSNVFDYFDSNGIAVDKNKVNFDY